MREFEKWKNENKYSLMQEYDAGKFSGNSMISTDDCTFEDFCMGKWQKRYY